MRVSVVIPAKNEENGLRTLLPRLCEISGIDEVVVVDDGSKDGTRSVCEEHGVTVLTQPYSKGNGAAIKTGAQHATGDVVVFMDADGQHDPDDIPRLLLKLAEGYDLVVGARSGFGSQASIARWGANSFYNRLASWMVGQRIDALVQHVGIFAANDTRLRALQGGRHGARQRRNL